MSLVHMKILRIENNDAIVKYSIRSPDLSRSNEWEEIGIVTINKLEKEYDFCPKGSAELIEFMPPSFYNLEDSERKILLTTKYKDYSCGAWAMRINHWILTLINRNNYPEIYPNDEFSGEVAPYPL